MQADLEKIMEDSVVIALDSSKHDEFGEDELIVRSEASRLEDTWRSTGLWNCFRATVFRTTTERLQEEVLDTLIYKYSIPRLRPLLCFTSIDQLFGL